MYLKVFLCDFSRTKRKKKEAKISPPPKFSNLGQDEKWDWGWLPKVAYHRPGFKNRQEKYSAPKPFMVATKIIIIIINVR